MEKESYLIIRVFSEDRLIAKTEIYVGDRNDQEIKELRRENIDYFCKIFINIEKIITFVTRNNYVG